MLYNRSMQSELGLEVTIKEDYYEPPVVPVIPITDRDHRMHAHLVETEHLFNPDRHSVTSGNSFQVPNTLFNNIFEEMWLRGQLLNQYGQFVKTFDVEAQTQTLQTDWKATELSIGTFNRNSLLAKVSCAMDWYTYATRRILPVRGYPGRRGKATYMVNMPMPNLSAANTLVGCFGKVGYVNASSAADLANAAYTSLTRIALGIRDLTPPDDYAAAFPSANQLYTSGLIVMSYMRFQLFR